MVRGLVDAGAKVAILGRRAHVCEELANSLNSSSQDKDTVALACPCDVLDRSTLESARDAIIAAFGSIDILVNAAGGNVADATIQPTESFFDKPIDAFEKVVNLNFNGTVLPCMVFGKVMSEQDSGGVVVNISSMAAKEPAITRVLGYSASKAAIDNFTRSLAVEFARKHGQKLRVNAIAPGFFLAEQNRSLLLNPDGTPTSRGGDIVRGTPMGRYGQPEELVGTLVLLCSDASRFVTGVVVPVDGGFGSYSGV
jgi:NAD(P)-dependent dehydrogenase (short-subunit alcohol dehydrogenase family)